MRIRRCDATPAYQLLGLHMLYEGDVIDAVCGHLKKCGYRIRQELRPNERGDDIIAINPSNGREVYVEAKGETSSLKSSKGYGRPFDSSQCRVHVAGAFFKAAATVQSTPNDVIRCAAIALPDTPCHRARVGEIDKILEELGIVVIWVDSNKKVTCSASF